MSKTLKVKIDEKEFDMVSFSPACLKLMKITTVEFAYLEMHSKEQLIEKMQNLTNQKFNFTLKLKKNSLKDDLQYIIDDVETEACISVEANQFKSETENQPKERQLRKRKHLP